MMVIFLLMLTVLAFIFVPFLGIWALNTLFGLSIAYNIQTWAAAFILEIIVGGTKYSHK